MLDDLITFLLYVGFVAFFLIVRAIRKRGRTEQEAEYDEYDDEPAIVPETLDYARREQARQAFASAPPPCESYAAPIPPPHRSTLRDKSMPSEVHVEEHIESAPVEPQIPKRGKSGAARHADAHIATTYAERTPGTDSAGRKSRARKRITEWLPRGRTDVRRAFIMSEILSPPKGMRGR